MFRSLSVTASALLLLTAVASVPVQAEAPLDGPLPPADVRSTWTANGTLLEWTPPVAGSQDLTGYAIYQVDPAGETLLATVDPDVTQYLAPNGNQSDLFWIRSMEGPAKSAPSAPTTPYPRCNPVWVTPFDLRPNCLYPIPIIECSEDAPEQGRDLCPFVPQSILTLIDP